MSTVRNDFGTVQHTGSYFEWEINNFSTCCEKVGEYISSPIFSTNFLHKDVQWEMRLYSKGKTYKNNDHISLFIECLSQEAITADITFSLLDNKNCRQCETKMKQQLIYKEGESWGFHKFALQDFVTDKSNHVISVTDTIKIQCEIVVKSSNKIINDTLVDHTSGYSDDFESLLETGDYSDVTFLVDGIEIKAHKAIITSRSPVFKAMFEHDMKEKKENVITITDVNCEVMKEVLRYVYASKVKNMRNLSSEILLAAEKYSIEKLKHLCERELSKSIRTKNVFDILELATMCNSKFLESQAASFILRNNLS